MTTHHDETSEYEGLSERWRHAAREVGGVGKSNTQFREDVADAAVRVVLQELQATAAQDGNLDDLLWYERFGALLREAKDVCPRCEDSGEIQVGGSSLNPRVGVRGPDPQCDDVVRCPECQGTGVRGAS